MLKTVLSTTLIISTFSLNAMAYDETKAAQLNKFYSHVTQKNAAKSTLKIEAPEVMKMLRDKVKFTFLDIRTEGEMAVIGLKTPNRLEIPLEHLFEKKNLDRLPTDEPIVLVCHSGSRAMLAVADLKMLGFRNIRVMKNGMVAIAVGANVKESPLK